MRLKYEDSLCRPASGNPVFLKVFPPVRRVYRRNPPTPAVSSSPLALRITSSMSVALLDVVSSVRFPSLK